MKRIYLVTFSLLSFFFATAQKPVANFSVSADTICQDDIIILTDLSTNNPTSWKWSFPGALISSSTDQNPITFYQPGSYDVKLVVSNSSGSDSLTLTNCVTSVASPPVSVVWQSHDTLFCSTDPSYVMYIWYRDTTRISWGAQDTFIVITQPGNYNIAVVNSNCCAISVGINGWDAPVHNAPSDTRSGTDCFWLTLGVKNKPDDNLFSIYPNPATNELTIQSSLPANTAVSIINIVGQTVYQSAITNPQSEIDISFLSSGIYFLELNPVGCTSNGIKAESGRVVKKFVKE